MRVAAAVAAAAAAAAIECEWERYGRGSERGLRAPSRPRVGVAARPDVPIRWLGDNGSIYTTLDTICTAEWLDLAPVATPVASPQLNRMSEAFVDTTRRDYWRAPIHPRPLFP